MADKNINIKSWNGTDWDKLTLGASVDLEQDKFLRLQLDYIKGTTQYPTFTNGNITKIEHKLSVTPFTVIRTDDFTYTATKITEVRTLSTNETLTLEYNYDASGNYTGTVIS